jgi:hypothetical protein
MWQIVIVVWDIKVFLLSDSKQISKADTMGMGHYLYLRRVGKTIIDRSTLNWHIDTLLYTVGKKTGAINAPVDLY